MLKKNLDFYVTDVVLVILSSIWNMFDIFSSVSGVDFEQVNADWVCQFVPLWQIV